MIERGLYIYGWSVIAYMACSMVYPRAVGVLYTYTRAGLSRARARWLSRRRSAVLEEKTWSLGYTYSFFCCCCASVSGRKWRNKGKISLSVCDAVAAALCPRANYTRAPRRERVRSMGIYTYIHIAASSLLTWPIVEWESWKIVDERERMYIMLGECVSRLWYVFLPQTAMKWNCADDWCWCRTQSAGD